MKAIHCFQAIPSAFRWICGEDCKLNHHTRKGMSQSARAGGRGKRKGRNAPSGASPPIPPSTSGSPPASSAPPAASGAYSMAPFNPVLARQQAQEKKYPLWKYVTRKDGPEAKLGGGGKVSWRCNFCKHEFMSTYFRVKGHLLALPSCRISSCKAVTTKF